MIYITKPMLNLNLLNQSKIVKINSEQLSRSCSTKLHIQCKLQVLRIINFGIMRDTHKPGVLIPRVKLDLNIFILYQNINKLFRKK